ncbi:MAG: InlB B-repeat-containing protein [Clostridiales bacterium]|nr:InlB B-repeat-containing protein [Clostridiales bacterium]
MPGIDITSPATFANPSTTHNFSATGVFPNGQNLSAVTVAWGVKNAPTGVSINSTSGALTTTAATPSGNITVTVSYNGYVYEAEFYYTAPRKVTLTDYNGAHTNSPNPVPVNVGSSTTLPNYGNFTGTAYSFYGWMLSTTSFLNEQPSAPALVHSLPSFSYTPSGDVELYAIYRKSDGSGGYIYTRAPKYAVTLDDRGSTSDVQVSPGSSTTLPGSAYGSWGFYGWILSSTSFTNGQTTAPTPLVGSPYTPSGDVTLYAIYLRNGIYTREPTAPFNPANYTPVSTLGAQARMNLAGIRFGGAMDVKELNKIAAESLSGITVQYGMLLAAYPFSPVVGEEIVDNNGGYAMDFKGGMGVLYVIQSSVTGNFSLAGCTLPNPQLANVICSENGGNQNFAWDPGFGVDIGKRSAAEVLAILGKNGGIGLTLFDVINSGGACVSIQYATVIDDLGTILARQGFYFAFRPYVIITGEFEVGVVSSYAFYGQQRVNSAWRIINGSEITSGGGLTHASFAAPDIQLNPFAGPGAPFLPIAP